MEMDSCMNIFTCQYLLIGLQIVKTLAQHISNRVFNVLHIFCKFFKFLHRILYHLLSETQCESCQIKIFSATKP